MKKYFCSMLLTSTLIAVFVCTLSSDEVSIQVKKAVMRSKPSFLGKKVGTLNYATRLEVLKEKASWYQVKEGSGIEGWIHKTSTTEKNITLKSGSQTARVSDDEQAIAGKGFSEDVESEYRKSKDYNYIWVDKMQNNWNASEDNIKKFIEEGRLTLSDEGLGD